MKLFNFDWFISEERKELNRLKVEGQKFKNILLNAKIDEVFDKPERPYKKLIWNNDNITIVFEGGVTISQNNVSLDLFESIKECKTEGQINKLLNPEPSEFDWAIFDKKLIMEGSNILKYNTDFEFIGSKVFLVGVNLELAPIVLTSFIDIEEKSTNKDNPINELREAYEALKMFWRWCALNPIESSRNDLLKFVKDNDVKITQNGQLVLYRRANLVKEINPLVDFVSKQHFKIKQWKKSPSNYWVFSKDDGSFVLHPNDSWSSLGNLEQLYISLPTIENNHLTDAHTGKMKIVVGDVYKIEEDKVDLDNKRDCSRGLHLAAKTYNYSGFGNTALLCIANPSKVRSVPVSETAKMRVSEMFIASILEVDEDGHYMDDDVDIVQFDTDYFKSSVEELEEQLRTKSFEKLSCQDHMPVLNIINIQDITNQLKQRVINI